MSAREGEVGIIPGSMGARSFIVRGLGKEESFQSCSHGAGRRMSRSEARKRFTLADHRAATADVECRKDEQVIDETPAAYKDIDAVMTAQNDLVEVVHTLKQVVCVRDNNKNKRLQRSHSASARQPMDRARCRNCLARAALPANAPCGGARAKRTLALRPLTGTDANRRVNRPLRRQWRSHPRERSWAAGCWCAI